MKLYSYSIPGLLILFISIFTLVRTQEEVKITIEPSSKLSELYQQLGDAYPDHHLTSYNDEMVKRGKDLIHIGKTKAPDGRKSVSISKFYTCTSCHNVEREDPDLKVVDPEARLTYAKTNDLPYLQGSTFWGVVNRETWYNDDYVLKYGALVEKAEKSLKESIQLCAQVCAQGRKLEAWEMESILAYFWSLEMTVEDLNLSDDQLKKLNQEIKEGKKEEVKSFLKSQYLLKSPATFADMPKSKKEGYPLKGRPENGKVIYQLGCQHCHHPYGESDLVLDDSKYTLKWLKKNITADTHESLYEIIRKGTYSEMGHKEYMPLYTAEKMSDQQIEDLRAYIEKGAN